MTVKTASQQRVRLVLSGLSNEAIDNINNREYIQFKSENDLLARVDDKKEIKFFELERSNRSWDAYFDVKGEFLGKTVCVI